MSGVFIGVLRSGSIEVVRAHLGGLDVDITDVLEMPESGGAPPPDVPPVATDAPESPLDFEGPVKIGAVTVTFSNGIPVRAVFDPNPRRQAGFPPEAWPAFVDAFPPAMLLPMVALTFLESDFVEDAHNPSTLEDSWGPWQINRYAWPDVTVEQATNWRTAAGIARAIYDYQGWGAWYHSATLLGLI